MYIEVKTMKKFCESLTKHAMQIINLKESELIRVIFKRSY